IAQRTRAAGGAVLQAPALVAEPGGGQAVIVRDTQGRNLRFVHGDTRHSDTDCSSDHPVRLAHAVMNSHDVAEAGDHHSIALADADNDCLNHIAFLMPDLESVMRGGGRMKDAGYGIEWGPGRHGPGDNAFNYFIGPAGFVIEYTAEVEQVDDQHVARGPEDWKWA